MSDPQPYSWGYDRSTFESEPGARTFSVSIYQWIPKASGLGLKKAGASRVCGYTAEPRAVYAKLDELCTRLNGETLKVKGRPDWLQKQYSLPQPAAARRVTVSDRLTEMTKTVLEPKLAAQGFRRNGRRLWRNDTKTCHVIETTFSTWGTSKRNRFWLEVGVFWHEVEAVLQNSQCGKLPPTAISCTFRIGQGQLAPRTEQTDWELELDTDLNAMGNAVLGVIERHALPWLEFRSELEHATIDKFPRWNSRANRTRVEELVGGMSLPVFLCMQGKRDEAAKVLTKWLSWDTDKTLTLARRLEIELSKPGS